MKLLNSNRTGHIAAATALGVVVLLAAVATGHEQLVVTSVAIPVWELIATPDMDVNSRSARRGPWYRRLWVLWWKPYALAVGHRSRWSHSLVFGLPMRIVFGPLLFLLLPLAFEGPWTEPVALFYSQWWPWVLLGCAGADTLHMVKDGYTLGEVVFGKKYA